MSASNEITYFIQSLKTSERISIINANLKLFPNIKIFDAINGYNVYETTDCLLKSQLKLKYLSFNTYGTLANFLTKYNAFKYQIDNNIKYMCLIEDDLLLKPNFQEFIVNNTKLLDNSNINMLRLDKWGEGYVTSIKGAINIINYIQKNGIIENIDNQLRLYCGNEKRLYNTPWTLMVPSNKGDCLKTQKIPSICQPNKFKNGFMNRFSMNS